MFQWQHHVKTRSCFDLKRYMLRNNLKCRGIKFPSTLNMLPPPPLIKADWRIDSLFLSFLMVSVVWIKKDVRLHDHGPL